MNRHRSNWSAMGSGESDNSHLKATSTEEFKRQILPLFNPCNQEESWANAVQALREIKESFTF